MKNDRPEWLLPLAMLVLALAGAPTSNAQATYAVLYNFGPNLAPINPNFSGIVVQGYDGDLHSSTCGPEEGGGTAPFGSAFSIAPSGALNLFRFSAVANCPQGGLTLGSDGVFYGTTVRGGKNHSGVLFKMTPNGALRGLHQFVGGGDGGTPYAPPIQGSDGNFYGTTSQAKRLGGHGTIYKITPTGEFTTLYQFDGSHGAFPYAPLVEGADGNFYGTAAQGGSTNNGVIFKVSASGKFAVLYNFDTTHGANPYGPLVQGVDGSFYGTTAYGGTGKTGVIFKITAAGVFTILHNMNGTTDGAIPFAGLVQATDGNFYGVDYSGGNMTACLNGCGTVFKITPTGTYTVVYNFDITTGLNPSTTMMQHTNGILYGETFSGGSFTDVCQSGCGVFFSLDVGLAPFIHLVNTTAKVGGAVQILGQGFTGTTAVALNGTAAAFRVVSDTYLTATVPGGATTGFVTVTTPGGTLTSNKQLHVKP